jgi:peptide-methionine (R)-S-oxide reductase
MRLSWRREFEVTICFLLSPVQWLFLTAGAKETTLPFKTPEEWHRILTPEQYYVLREKNTEPAFTGQYDKHYKKGIYRCAGCVLDLYASEDKFDSKTGWPSFTRPVAEENIATAIDTYYLWERTELLCTRCNGHLEHVFDDGPPPTGLRHCINSVSLTFVLGE